MQSSLLAFLMVACGGAMGSAARYGVSLVTERFAVQPHIGTLTVNVLGCLLIGIISQLSVNSTILSPGLRLFLTVGFCGGFTTFSTYVAEILSLADTGQPLIPLVYAVSSVVLGFVSLIAGVWIVKALL